MHRTPVPLALRVTLCHSVSLRVIACHCVSLLVIACHCVSLRVTACQSVSLRVIVCHSLESMGMRLDDTRQREHATRMSLHAIEQHLASLDQHLSLSYTLDPPQLLERSPSGASDLGRLRRPSVVTSALVETNEAAVIAGAAAFLTSVSLQSRFCSVICYRLYRKLFKTG